jgi:hypothetical protein
VEAYRQRNEPIWKLPCCHSHNEPIWKLPCCHKHNEPIWKLPCCHKHNEPVWKLPCCHKHNEPIWKHPCCHHHNETIWKLPCCHQTFWCKVTFPIELCRKRSRPYAAAQGSALLDAQPHHLQSRATTHPVRAALFASVPQLAPMTPTASLGRPQVASAARIDPPQAPKASLLQLPQACVGRQGIAKLDMGDLAAALIVAQQSSMHGMVI